MNRTAKILMGASIAVFVASLACRKHIRRSCARNAKSSSSDSKPVCEGNYSWLKHGDKYVCTYDDGIYAGVGSSEHLETAKKLSLINAMRNKS